MQAFTEKFDARLMADAALAEGPRAGPPLAGVTAADEARVPAAGGAPVAVAQTAASRRTGSWFVNDPSLPLHGVAAVKWFLGKDGGDSWRFTLTETGGVDAKSIVTSGAG